MKQAQPNPIVAVVAEDFEPRLRLSVVLEDGALRLRLPQEREVGPNGVVSRLGRAAEQELDGENERQQPGTVGSHHFAERFNAQACGEQAASKAATQPQCEPPTPMGAADEGNSGASPTERAIVGPPG